MPRNLFPTNNPLDPGVPVERFDEEFDEGEHQANDSGPSYLRDDSYYSRNDAGEYSWM